MDTAPDSPADSAGNPTQSLLQRTFTLYPRCRGALYLSKLAFEYEPEAAPPQDSQPLPGLPVEDIHMEADDEEICKRCLDRLIFASYRLRRMVLKSVVGDWERGRW